MPLHEVVSPDWDELYNDFVDDWVEEAIKEKAVIVKRLLDSHTRKTTIHNIVFNNIKDWATRVKENAGDVRKYSMVKHSSKFEQLVLEKVKKYGIRVKRYMRNRKRIKGYYRTNVKWSNVEVNTILANRDISLKALQKMIPAHTYESIRMKRSRLLRS